MYFILSILDFIHDGSWFFSFSEMLFVYTLLSFLPSSSNSRQNRRTVIRLGECNNWTILETFSALTVQFFQLLVLVVQSSSHISVSLAEVVWHNQTICLHRLRSLWAAVTANRWWIRALSIDYWSIKAFLSDHWSLHGLLEPYPVLVTAANNALLYILIKP